MFKIKSERIRIGTNKIKLDVNVKVFARAQIINHNMPPIPLFKCQISTDDASLIGDILKEAKFVEQQPSPGTFVRYDSHEHLQIDVSPSFESPSIICCCSNVSVSLPRLLSCLRLDSSSTIHLIVFLQPSECVDWNTLMELIGRYNLSLGIVHQRDLLSGKLNELVHVFVNETATKNAATNTPVRDGSRAHIQVIHLRFFRFLSDVCRAA